MTHHSNDFLECSLSLARRVCGVSLLCAWGIGLGLAGCAKAPPSLDEQFAESPTAEPAAESDLQAEHASGAAGKQDIHLVSASEMTGEKKGSPEALIQEIVHLRTAPLDVVRQPKVGRPGEFEEAHLSPEQMEREKIRRYEQTVRLASQVILKTHRDPEQEQFFNSAVHYLCDARMQLGLAGQENQSQLLAENATALFQRDPTSFAAIESAARVVQLTQSLAMRQGDEKLQWTLAFARQSRLFATNFPQETGRAAVNLLAAGQLCDQLGQLQEAQSCLTWIEQSFPGTPYSEEAAGALRRYRLKGSTLDQFGGSTLDGGHYSIDQSRGQPVLIAFWASNSEEFRKDLPAIQAAVEQSAGKLQVIGVNLDRDLAAATAARRRLKLDWPHIVDSDESRRGIHNPVAHYYGVTQVPSYWLVDSQGTVHSINLQVSELPQALPALATR